MLLVCPSIHVHVCLSVCLCINVHVSDCTCMYVCMHTFNHLKIIGVIIVITGNSLFELQRRENQCLLTVRLIMRHDFVG